jgi:hypothetical protein
MPNVLLNNQNKPFLQWNYDNENNWLYLNWIGYISKENVIKGAELALKLIQENNITYLLNDNRELQGPWGDTGDWLETYVIPKAMAAGLLYFAHVLSPGIAGALSAQDLHRRLVGTLNMQLFGNIEKATAWLKSQQQANPLS